MEIGALSDSHGHMGNLRRVIKGLREVGVHRIVHLGDDYDDVRALPGDKGASILQLLGVFCASYQKPWIPNRIIA
jgi:predicted phosphodiesterase